MLMIEDAVIIGAGPAGLAAALQLTRHGVTPVVFESGCAGGLLRNANLVENYPGFPEGIAGNELADRFVKQALLAGVKIVEEKVTALCREKDLFHIMTDKGILLSRTAVITSGTKPRTPTGIAINDSCREKVVYEISSMLHFENRHFLIVGAGDAAFDYGLSLCRKNTVTILNRGTVFKCLPLLKARAAVLSAITCRTNASVSEISPAEEGRLLVKGLLSGKPVTIQTDYVVVAIGRDPQTDFISPSLLNRLGELEDHGILHMAGDVRNGMFRQTAIAVGNGILAGMRVCNTLRELKGDA